MFASSWLRQLQRRWFLRRPIRTVRRLPQHVRPRLEALEDRTLLTAPGGVTIPTLTGTAGQFQGFTDLSDTKFLGTTFNVNGGFGSFTNGWGIGANLNVQGKVGFDASYDVSGGNVSATYNNLALSQNYAEPTQFGQQVTFTPQNTNVSYGTGTFDTTSPQAGAGLALDAGINGSISGGLELAGYMLGGSTTFGGSVDQSLISYDTINGLEVLGKPLSSLFSASGGGVSGTVGVSPYGEVELPVEIAPGISLKLGVTQVNNYTGLKEDLSLAAGVEGEGNVPSIDGAIELGAATEQLPNIALSSSSLQSGNVLSDTEESSVASLDLQMGPLVASLLGFPEAGALVSTDTITIGPISLSITPISFTLGPDVKFVQTGTITPTNSLTYNFTDSSGNTMNVDVTKDGTDLGQVSSVTFTPGADNIGIKFNGNPITVTPTWTTELDYTNEIDLDVDLQGTLTVLELTGSASLGPLSGSFTLGPLYQHTWDFHDWKLATVYDNTFNIATQTQTLTPFTIGDTFHPDLVVTTTTDGNTQGTLRYAVESANVLGATSSAPEVIQLGSGTYNLTIGPSGTDDGTSGDLDVTGENVIIQGAGAGQTIINAKGLGDRIFDVNSGAGLTLDGVTLENGTASSGDKPDGGAIFNSGTLTVNNCDLYDNSGVNGGAIFNTGTATITNSTLDNNIATGALQVAGGGGAIVNDYGTLDITDSTLDDNSATGGGAIENFASLTITNSTLSGNSASYGGGVASTSGGPGTQLNILNSTLYGNTASVFGGALYVLPGSPTYLINDTLTRNRANSSGTNSNSAGGGIYVSSGATVYLGNTIVTGNYNGTGTTPDDIDGTVDSTSSNNLIGSGGSGGLTDGTNGNLVDDNPGLGTFGNYGGPTDTVPLLPGSLAIDKGSNALATQYGLTTDQRGYSRTVNGTVDIGAVEYQYDLALFGFVAPGHFYSTVPNTVAYVFVLNNNGPDSVGDATLTVPLPTGTVFESVYNLPSGWTETDPGVGNNGTVTIKDTNNLNSGDGESFEITAQVQNTAGTVLTTTATAGSTFWDNNQQNNSVTLTVINEQEGQTFDKVPLFHFTDPKILSAPVVNTPTVSSGGTLVNGTYYYTVTSTTATGESMPSNEVLATATTGNNSEVELTWGQVAGATGYKIYQGTSPGAENTLIATIASGTTVSFTDTGSETTSAASPPTPNIFTASVGWGNGSSNTSSDGSGTVSVVADPNGGFDVLGSHTFAEEGEYSNTVSVAGLDGTQYSLLPFLGVTQQMFFVTDAPLTATAGALTPPPNATINQPISSPALTNAVLYHFTDATNPNATASAFTASVNWGDNSGNTSSDGSGNVSVVADPNGGFDVIGISHTYAKPGSFGISVSVTGSDGTTYSQPNAFTFNNGALLFHFSDANPNAAVSDFKATVNWGDNSSNTSSDGTGNVFLVANPNGGFDVYGLHTYTQIVNPGTFTVTVNDVGGASTSASDANFQVLNPDKPLTAGNLNVPSVTTEGQSIGNQLLFQFTDADANAQAADYLATVSWGDGTFDNSKDSSNSVQVQQISTNSDGSIVFGVYGSHTFSEGSSYFAVRVTDLGDAGVDTGGQVVSAGSSTLLNITDPPPANVTASSTGFSASEGSMSTVQTLATFTDPGSPESDANAYIALVQWGDGSVTATNLAAQANYTQASVNSQGQITENTGNVISASNVGGIVLGSDGKTFSVKLAHQYAEEGSYTITIILIHDGVLSTPITTTANVTDPAVVVKTGSTFSATEGITSSVQTVATFTDPAGPESDANAYTATVKWGDGNSSTATLANGGIVLGSDGKTFSVGLAHQYADEGTYTITITINHEGILSQVTITANVADNDKLTATGAASLTSTAGAPLAGVKLATFTDTYTGNTASDFTATIDWGDGQTSTGTVSGSNGQFTVTGSHTYAKAGTYTIGVTIGDDGGTAKAAASDNVAVASLNQGVVAGLTGTIGFWANNNGQALIDSFNVTPSNPNPTALADWLATTFPNLYGSLAGETNSQVAAYFQTQFNQSGPKAQAQTLAVALNVYATTLSLGGNAGAAYGFTVSAAGLGAYSYNVGSDGAAFGVANNTTLNVYQLLLAVNNKAVNGVLYDDSEVADLFSNLNYAGDIG